MGKYSTGTLFFLVAFLAAMLATYRFLPVFPPMKPYYSGLVLSACWTFATAGSFIPVAVKQQFLSNRFWYVFVIISMIGTWSGFILLYAFFCYAGRKPSPFPGLGAGYFLLSYCQILCSGTLS